MAFSESTKLVVKKKAHFTCCWCRDQRNKVDIHHIIPESEGGSDDEDNAAPLCGTCHSLYGGNPDLRKEIRLRRDQWYEICSQIRALEPEWPLALDIPLLDFCFKRLPRIFCPVRTGLLFADRELDPEDPPQSYLMIYFKEHRHYAEGYWNTEKGKWLWIQAGLHSFMGINLQVRARTEQDVRALMGSLRGDEKWCELHGESKGAEGEGLGDHILVLPEEGKIKLRISVRSQMGSLIAFYVYLSSKAAGRLADYLNDEGFTRPFHE